MTNTTSALPRTASGLRRTYSKSFSFDRFLSILFKASGFSSPLAAFAAKGLFVCLYRKGACKTAKPSSAGFPMVPIGCYQARCQHHTAFLYIILKPPFPASFRQSPCPFALCRGQALFCPGIAGKVPNHAFSQATFIFLFERYNFHTARIAGYIISFFSYSNFLLRRCF